MRNHHLIITATRDNKSIRGSKPTSMVGGTPVVVKGDIKLNWFNMENELRRSGTRLLSDVYRKVLA